MKQIKKRLKKQLEDMEELLKQDEDDTLPYGKNFHEEMEKLIEEAMEGISSPSS